MKPSLLASLALVCLAAALGYRAVPGNEQTLNHDKEPKMFKSVVHINFSDSERQKSGLGNVANMLKGVDEFEIEVVCHGGGIGLLVKDQSQHAAEVERLLKAGVRFAACENTMQKKSIEKDSLLAGVVTVPSGAIEVVKKQQNGFGYFKP